MPHFARISVGVLADIQLGSLRSNRVGSVGMLLSLLRRLEDSNMFLEDVSVLHYLLGMAGEVGLAGDERDSGIWHGDLSFHVICRRIARW